MEGGCIRLSVHAKRFIFLIIKNKLDVTTQLHEEIIINQNVATIFTPRIDKATILCNHLPAETSILNVGINFIQQYANCTIATSEFVQKNLNQNQISDTIQINNLNQLMTTGLRDIDASFDNININECYFRHNSNQQSQPTNDNWTT